MSSWSCSSSLTAGVSASGCSSEVSSSPELSVVVVSSSVLLKLEFPSSEGTSAHGLKELCQAFSDVSLGILKVKNGVNNPEYCKRNCCTQQLMASQVRLRPAIIMHKIVGA